MHKPGIIWIQSKHLRSLPEAIRDIFVILYDLFTFKLAEWFKIHSEEECEGCCFNFGRWISVIFEHFPALWIPENVLYVEDKNLSDTNTAWSYSTVCELLNTEYLIAWQNYGNLKSALQTVTTIHIIIACCVVAITGITGRAKFVY